MGDFCTWRSLWWFDPSGSSGHRITCTYVLTRNMTWITAYVSIAQNIRTHLLWAEQFLAVINAQVNYKYLMFSDHERALACCSHNGPTVEFTRIARCAGCRCNGAVLRQLLLSVWSRCSRASVRVEVDGHREGMQLVGGEWVLCRTGNIINIRHKITVNLCTATHEIKMRGIF